MSSKPNRRRQQRLNFPPEVEARLVFGYPFPGGHRCVMPLRDLSPGGMAFTLNLDLPGLDIGQSIEQAELIVLGRGPGATVASTGTWPLASSDSTNPGRT